MGESAKRIMFVNSEIYPYLPENHIADIGRYLPQGIQERRKEIRSFMPRYGCINERKNQLHEVIRLSGMNIIINDVDRPLIIKVASIAAARMQVYFIDNDDYFKRKQIYADEKGVFFQDNAERAVFFARGVLETAKKLRWTPDIIHCQGWITHILPLFLKKVYREDPIFAGTKIVLSLYDDTPKDLFAGDFASLAKLGQISDADVALLNEPTGTNLAKLAAQYSDGVIIGSEGADQEVIGYCKELGLPVLPFNKQSYEDGSYIDEYNGFYEQLQ
ncbi:MAG: glycogen/starch synthase [Bacteroidales bacterium]|nr:glycogen/starch synthase [Bacteroidales bacterium]MBR6230068.1 glycogen/starch synthase [Eubacterium sp.]